MWILDPGSHGALFGKFVILGKFVAIEFDAEARPFRHLHLSPYEFELPSCNHVIGEVVVMRIGRGDEIRKRRGQVQHGGLRDTEFRATVHADVDSHGFAKLTS